jgi:hypothetical protein
MTPLSRFRSRTVLRQWLSIAAVIATPGIALAQKDYSAGKTPEQLFTSDCVTCHASPQGLSQRRDARSLTAFLRDHYTTKLQWAALLANYLVRVRETGQTGLETAAAKGDERDAKSAVETMQSKVRAYATVGQEAKPPVERAAQ